MITFTQEEQGSRKYLVYEKKPNDSQDTIAVEMMSNNKIEGLVPFTYIRIDETVYMKYDITGRKSLKKYLDTAIGRRKFLNILESMMDAMISAEDYMLALSSFVLDTEYIYVNPLTMKVSMVVLPVKCQETSIESFLRELILGVQYDQTEDCSYVAALINFFSTSATFSVYAFREQVIRFKEEKPAAKMGKPAAPSVPLSAEKKPLYPLKPEQKKSLSLLPEAQKKSVRLSAAESVSVADRSVPSPEKQQWIDILFSDEEETEKKKGFFGRWQKEEKKEKEKPEKEKKGLFAKKSEKKQITDSETESDLKKAFGEFAIPGMDFQSRVQKSIENEKKETGQYQKHDVAIPSQTVNVHQDAVDRMDFGDTLFLEEDSEDTLWLDPEENTSASGFALYRCSTKESFEIRGDVVRVGRSPSVAEICISGNRSVGRIHAILYVRDGQVFIEDNNSKNKTYVDGTALCPGEPPKPLFHGSKIRMGDEELEFHVYE